MSAVHRTPARTDTTVVNAAIERFLQRAGARANELMQHANAFGNPHSAIRRMMQNDAVCDQLEKRARHRAGDLLDRAIALAKKIRHADAQRRLNTAHRRFWSPA